VGISKGVRIAVLDDKGTLIGLDQRPFVVVVLLLG
jgi:hypothetical protein